MRSDGAAVRSSVPVMLVVALACSMSVVWLVNRFEWFMVFFDWTRTDAFVFGCAKLWSVVFTFPLVASGIRMLAHALGRFSFS